MEVVDEIDFILQNLGSFLEHFCEFSVKWTLIAGLKLLSRNFFAQCSVEKWKIYCHWKKIIRQINYLVTALVKPLLSRHFCKNFWKFSHCDAQSVEGIDINHFVKSTYSYVNKNITFTKFCQKSVVVSRNSPSIRAATRPKNQRKMTNLKIVY